MAASKASRSSTPMNQQKLNDLRSGQRQQLDLSAGGRPVILGFARTIHGDADELILRIFLSHWAPARAGYP